MCKKRKKILQVQKSRKARARSRPQLSNWYIDNSLEKEIHGAMLYAAALQGEQAIVVYEKAPSQRLCRREESYLSFLANASTGNVC